MDANRNGLVERSRGHAAAIAERFALFDYNRDDVVSGAEIARGSVSDVHPPTTTFTDRHTVTLGGKRVTMTLPRAPRTPTTARCCTSPTSARCSAPTSCRSSGCRAAWRQRVGAWIDALTHHQRARLRARADRPRAGGHEEGRRRRRCAICEDISKGVAAGIGAGRSLAEIQKTLTLDAYKGFERWDTSREAHIAAVYATLKGTRPGAATGTR